MERERRNLEFSHSIENVIKRKVHFTAKCEYLYVCMWNDAMITQKKKKNGTLEFV